MSLSTPQVQIQAGLEDEHVVKIFDTISLPEKGQLFIIMEFCEGGNLLQWIKRNRRHQQLNQTVRADPVCLSVAAAKQPSIVSRFTDISVA